MQLFHITPFQTPCLPFLCSQAGTSRSSRQPVRRPSLPSFSPCRKGLASTTVFHLSLLCFSLPFPRWGRPFPFLLCRRNHPHSNLQVYASYATRHPQSPLVKPSPTCILPQSYCGSSTGSWLSTQSWNLFLAHPTGGLHKPIPRKPFWADRCLHYSGLWK